MYVCIYVYIFEDIGNIKFENNYEHYFFFKSMSL